MTVRTAAFALALAVAAGCQQRMAQQPYYKPYEPTTFFADGRSSRPYEEGVVTRGQPLDDSLLVSGLTPEGKKYKPLTAQPDGGPGEGVTTRLPGAPDSVDNYVKEFPFEIKDADVARGMTMYSAYCVECHGVLGNGGGKIVERGYLRPTSYHTEPQEAKEPPEVAKVKDQTVYGYSRGFKRWAIDVPLREVPVGYIFEVITKGYGGMPAHAAQVKPEDRWRIIAYVRALQLSRHAELAKLPAALAAEARQKADAGDKK